MSFITGIKDALIRKLARSFLLKWIDGYKTPIFRAVQAINVLLVVVLTSCSELSALSGYDVCKIASMLNGHWVAISTFLGQIGLEIGIQDAKAKAKLEKK